MIFDRYLFKNLAIATIFIAITLAAVILLTQSLRFLELVIESGASSSAFWILTLLALPRFFEIILPIALMAATVFVYNKMTMDSELVVMRANGIPPMALARPAIMLAGLTTVILWIMTMWAGPASLSNMQQMRQVIKAQYSTLLLREGVFNAVVPGLTVFIREKDKTGEMRGLMIHDSRAESDIPSTVVAKRGQILSNEDGQQVLVYEGSRQTINQDTNTLERLVFERYSIDLPDSTGPVRQRWKEPDERTIWQLLHPDQNNKRDIESQHEFTIEIHRRIVSPLLAPAFVLVVLSFLLLGPLDRRGQTLRIIGAVAITITIQGLYLAAFNLSLKSLWGLVFMYALVLIPIAAGIFFISSTGEKIRRRLLFGHVEAV